MDDVKLETYHMKTMLTQSSSQLTQFYFLVPLWLYVTVMFIGHFQKKKTVLDYWGDIFKGTPFVP